MADDNISFTRANEGYFYGAGAANLQQAIKDALELVPGPFPKNAETCAKTIHKVLKQASGNEDQTPDIETYYSRTGQPGRREYRVSWESGPYDWAIQASFVVMDATGRLCEPYYGFDLCLYDVE